MLSSLGLEEERFKAGETDEEYDFSPSPPPTPIPPIEGDIDVLFVLRLSLLASFNRDFLGVTPPPPPLPLSVVSIFIRSSSSSSSSSSSIADRLSLVAISMAD